MRMKYFYDRFRKGSIVIALAAVVALCMAGAAYASEPYWDAPDEAESTSGLVSTYGVRAGSAGPDFLGISGTNFDFSGGSASQETQYDYSGDDLGGYAGAGLAIWASSVNENVNPYYSNLYYNAVTPDAEATQATTWMKNEDESSWGDSFDAPSVNAYTGQPTINGLEYEPEIIFGDAKFVGWGNYDDGTSYIRSYLQGNTEYVPDYVNNDATNIWTQVYTMGKLASAADKITESSELSTRYEDSDATASAINYEKAIKGNMLYIASQIATCENVDKKTVAYLYAIDEEGTAYFFTPQANCMTYGNDTGKEEGNSDTNADANYAANNGTINLGYMGVLPFITNTFANENTVPGGIVMKVEDIYKANPACTVAPAGDEPDDALEGVDVIIYNTTKATSLDGTSGGKNSSGVASENNTILSDSYVKGWATDHGFCEDGLIIAGDDFGTSTNQDWTEAGATESGMAPLLYCQRNYTADKNARAAWAFSQVYPELYDYNANASYCYWVDNIYHVNSDKVPAVVQYMTNQLGDVVYSARYASTLEEYFEAGRCWWEHEGQYDPAWSGYSYYQGSSRASYYSGNPASAEPDYTIGIFTPNLQW